MKSYQNFKKIKAELQEASPARGSSLLIIVILFLALLIGWAALTEIDRVTRAEGRVVPSSQTQIIQAAETGVLQALHVEKGDYVEADQLLMEFDSTLLDSELERGAQRLAALQARRTRLEAEIEGVEPIFSPDLLQRLPEVVRSEMALFRAGQDEILAEREVLLAQEAQRQQELAEATVAKATAERTQALIEEELALIAPLVERRVEPETSLIALRRAEAEAQGALLASSADLERVRSSLAEVSRRIDALLARYRTNAHSDLSLVNAEMAELRAQLPALETRATRSEILSPVRGIVNQILLTTRGGVAQAGQALVEIVPLDEDLLVEAYVRPSDIAFLSPDQIARIKLTAYDYTRYGSIDGRIVGIGANAVTPTGFEQPVFVVEIAADNALIGSDGIPLDILPGMIAQVDILTGKRTVLDYFVEPVVRVQQTALRE